MNSIDHQWLYDIYPTKIRAGEPKPTELPAEASVAWDLSQAGLTCRLGRTVLKQLADDETDPLTDLTALHFLADRAVQEVLRIWKSPVFLGPSAIPGHDGALTVTLEHGSPHHTLLGVGLWVPEGKFSAEGVWVPSGEIKIDASLIPGEPLK